MIVCIEGGDAAGKMTQSTLLAKKLGGTRFAFPAYDTPAGQAILSQLNEEWVAAWANGLQERSKYDPLVFQSLQTINRLELLPDIYAALARGPVIFDRYSASALVYGGLDGLDREWLERINASLPHPDVWIYIDVPVEESFKRRPERRDRYEQDRVFLEKVRVSYLRLFEEEQRRAREVKAKGMAPQTWAVVDGMGSIEQVHERIVAVVGGV